MLAPTPGRCDTATELSALALRSDPLTARTWRDLPATTSSWSCDRRARFRWRGDATTIAATRQAGANKARWPSTCNMPEAGRRRTSSPGIEREAAASSARRRVRRTRVESDRRSREVSFTRTPWCGIASSASIGFGPSDLDLPLAVAPGRISRRPRKRRASGSEQAETSSAPPDLGNHGGAARATQGA